jgi:hypothetical protein
MIKRGKKAAEELLKGMYKVMKFQANTKKLINVRLKVTCSDNCTTVASQIETFFLQISAADLGQLKSNP